jgi:S-adenosylmethionine-diacylgycerolhomoserine-N-methlytransferase
LSGIVTADSQDRPDDIRDRMERMYRPQRLIYDLTRKYYLFGRDRLIAEMGLLPGERVIDIGCGTGRNLEAIARRYPGARLFGLDAAAVMLATTEKRFARAGLATPGLARASAEELDSEASFGIEAADHILFSYSLSMMDDPILALERAAASLAPGGRLHIVDFGPMDGLPQPLARAMRAWLDRFGVHHRPAVAATLRQLAQERGGNTRRTRLAGGYAEILRLALDPISRGKAL